MACVEFVRFRLEGVDEQELFRRRERAVRAVKARHPRLVGVPVLGRGEDGTWTDVWVYASRADAEAANADAGGIPDFLALVEVQRDVTIEVTEGPADGAP